MSVPKLLEVHPDRLILDGEDMPLLVERDSMLVRPGEGGVHVVTVTFLVEAVVVHAADRDEIARKAIHVHADPRSTDAEKDHWARLAGMS